LAEGQQEDDRLTAVALNTAAEEAAREAGHPAAVRMGSTGEVLPVLR
jgi:hypothetical protein